jgi:molybdate transport system regulatory protein
MRAPNTNSTRVRVRLVFDDQGMLGPGKVELLELIRDTGSIAAAGRRLGMSYKRAWMLVETMNAMFRQPLVESSRGGASHGGARVTPTGDRVIQIYRDFVATSSQAGASEIAKLEKLLAPPRRDISARK